MDFRNGTDFASFGSVSDNLERTMASNRLIEIILVSFLNGHKSLSPFGHRMLGESASSKGIVLVLGLLNAHRKHRSSASRGLADDDVRVVVFVHSDQAHERRLITDISDELKSGGHRVSFDAAA